MNTIRQKVYRLLRWSERYMKTDMLYVARGGFWVTFGRTITNILSLALIVAFANLLEKETYGLYRYILSLAGVLNIFTLTGMNSAVARAVAGGNEGAFKHSVVYQLKWNLLMVAAFFVLGGYYLLNADALLAVSFFILGLFVPATLAFNTYGAYLEGTKRFKLASLSSVISTLIYVGGILAAILLSGQILWLVIAYAATTFVATVYFYVYVQKKFKPKPQAKDGETLVYGRNLSFIRIIGTISAQIDKILLTQFWGTAQLAVYALAMAMPNRIIAYLKHAVGIGYPKFAAKTVKEIDTIFYRRVLQGALIGAIIALLYILIAPTIFTYLLPQYLEGIFFSQILALSFIFAMPNRYISLVLESQKLAKLILFVNVTNSLINILLYVILGIWGGIMGLVIAKVVGSLLGMTINITTWRINIRRLSATPV